ncbi:uncharacterized protein LOC108834792 [Raphanus sativus]|uniref:Uncharacterized protein LOC108834792 n=1 Tax=Raphanus sativus TaxID=3726 RepID=A0A6J0LUU5_RAPSA|nr:uncharacterized protein LOC108834792 [Raphanus sativus]
MDLAYPPGVLNPPEVRSEIGSVVLGDKRSDLMEGKQVGKVIEKESKSWVSTAEDKKSLKKYEVEVLTKDGKHSVAIPEAILSDSTPLWDDFVVGKFLDLAPHMAKVHMVVNKIWSYGEKDSKVDVYDVNATTMRFRISNPKIREKVLKRGMWNIVGVPMVVTKWSPKSEEEKQEENEIPMWVNLRKVPLHMYSWQGISFMTSTVGFPDKLHPETLACTNLEVAKVFVNVDISKALPKEIEFTKDRKEFTVEFYYPWLPAKCNGCGKWGHIERVCVRNGKEKKKKEDNVVMKSGSDEKVIEEENKLEKSVEGVDEALQEGDSSKKGEEVTVGQEDGKISDWSTVPLAKVGRSSPSHVSVVEISASKYSVLTVEDLKEGENETEEGEILTEDQEYNEEELLEESEQLRRIEDDKMEDDILENQSRGNDKAEMKKGYQKKRGQKLKAQDANPAKSTRPSRKKTNMSCFFWNVRGFNKSLKHSVVKEWIGRKEMKFGCILETRVKEIKAEKIIKGGFKE